MGGITLTVSIDRDDASAVGTAGELFRAIPIENGKTGGGDQNAETPEPFVTKFGMGDYVDDMILHTKIETDQPSRGVPGSCIPRWI